MEFRNDLFLDIVRWGKILYRFNKFVLSNKVIDPKETILISGSPRSGTTWFEEIVINLLGCTFVYEPLQPEWFPDSIDAGFKTRSSYIELNEKRQREEEYIKKMLEGKVFSVLPPFSFEPKRMMNYILGDRLVVKSVRMNRILPWFANNFEIKHIYLIIRHPCAVIASQLQSGFIGYRSIIPPYHRAFPTVKDIIDEVSEIRDIDPLIIKKLKKIKTKEEILAVAWCLDTYVPLNSKKPYPWTNIFYEDVIKNGDKIIRNIFDDVGIEISEIDTAILKKPSMTSWVEETKNITNVEKQLSKWKKALSDKQIERILKVVSDFGLDFYSYNIEPDYDRLKSFV